MIEANGDSETQPACAYRMKYLRWRLARMGFRIKMLRGPNATREKVAAELAKKRQRVVYLTGSGHGHAHAFRGYDGRFIFQVGSYQGAESRQRGAHFLSCNTARELGPDFVRRQGKAFFGYSVPFAWDDEKNLEAFFRCDAEIDLALASGASAGEALQRARARFDAEIAKQNLVAGKTRTGGMLQTLRDHLCGPSEKSRQYGDPDWRL